MSIEERPEMKERYLRHSSAKEECFEKYRKIKIKTKNVGLITCTYPIFMEFHTFYYSNTQTFEILSVISLVDGNIAPGNFAPGGFAPEKRFCTRRFRSHYTSEISLQEISLPEICPSRFLYENSLGAESKKTILLNPRGE